MIAKGLFLVVVGMMLGGFPPGHYLVTQDEVGTFQEVGEDGMVDLGFHFGSVRIQQIKPQMRIGYPTRIEVPGRLG